MAHPAFQPAHAWTLQTGDSLLYNRSLGDARHFFINEIDSVFGVDVVSGKEIWRRSSGSRSLNFVIGGCMTSNWVLIEPGVFERDSGRPLVDFQDSNCGLFDVYMGSACYWKQGFLCSYTHDVDGSAFTCGHFSLTDQKLTIMGRDTRLIGALVPDKLFLLRDLATKNPDGSIGSTTIRAFDPETRTNRWSHEFEGSADGFVDPGPRNRFYVRDRKRHELICGEADSGSVIWSLATLPSIPQLAGDSLVFAVGQDQILVANLDGSHRLTIQNPLSEPAHRSGAYSDTYVCEELGDAVFVLVPFEGIARLYDVFSGELLWSEQLPFLVLRFAGRNAIFIGFNTLLCYRWDEPYRSPHRPA